MGPEMSSRELLTSLDNARRDALEREIHVWRFRTSPCPSAEVELHSLLSSDEKAKADRLISPLHRTRSIAARAGLRLLAGRYVGRPAQELRFAYSPKGKPSLDGIPADETVAFNLSHSGDYAAVAFTRRRAVGIDLELIQERVKHAQLAERFFSSRENSWLRSLASAEQLRGFYRLWTVKEAWLKATGKGITLALDKVEVEFGPTGQATIQPPGAPGAEWFAQELALVAGYAAALVVEGEARAVRVGTLDLRP